MSKSKNQIIAYVTPEIKGIIKSMANENLCSESHIVLKILSDTLNKKVGNKYMLSDSPKPINKL